MKKIIYLSNSLIPSKSANSVHVINMASALSQYRGVELWHRKPYGHDFCQNLASYYGCDVKFKLRSTLYVGGALGTICSSFLSVITYFLSRDVVFYSRNPFAAAFCAIFRKSFIYEIHCMPSSRVIDFVESIIARSKNRIMTVSITRKLKDDYATFFNKKGIDLDRMIVLPDAAFDHISYATNVELNCKNRALRVAYSGAFYEGKGVFEVVLKIAPLLPNIEFFIAGGEATKLVKIAGSLPSNLKVVGRLKPSEVPNFLAEMDVLLLPNQETVRSQGGVDIGKYTSPLKLFEYLASGKLIIASDIPVLKEILTNGENCLLCEANSIEDWVKVIKNIDLESEIIKSIKINARKDFLSYYSWDARAKKIIEEIEKHNEKN